MAKPLPLSSYLTLHARSERHAMQRLRRLEAAGTITPLQRAQRLARDLPTRPDGELLWLHAATEEAAAAATDLFDLIVEDRLGLSAFLTTAHSVKPRPHSDIIACELPEENEAVVSRFLRHVRPSAICWVGNGFRPSLLWHAHAVGTPAMSVEAVENAAFLDIKAAFPGLRSVVHQSFDQAFVGSSSSASRWSSGGMSTATVETVGYLEASIRAEPLDETAFNGVSREIGTRPVWYAHRVSAGEVAQVLRAHEEAMRRAHRLLLIISPADQTAFLALEKYVAARPVSSTIYDEDGAIPENAQVIVVAAEGDEALWYRAASVTYLGGTQSNKSAHSPREAAAHGSAIIHGPIVSDHADLYARLSRAGATRLVRGDSDLAFAVRDLLAPDAAAKAANAAWDVTSASAMVTEHVVERLHVMLDRAEVLTT